MSDVALDPYTNHGHDGLLKNKYVINDETVDVLMKQALLQAQMGCDDSALWHDGWTSWKNKKISW